MIPALFHLPCPPSSPSCPISLTGSHEMQVKVSSRLCELDSSTGDLEQILKASFVRALVTRHTVDEDTSTFKLLCDDDTSSRTYEGDQICDYLVEYILPQGCHQD